MATYLANENAPAEAIKAARRAGFDVTWMSEIAPGADDDTVLAISVAEQRVLLTFDKDFGEMTFRRGKDASCGVILLRPRLRSPAYLGRFLVNVLKQNLDWVGHFTVAREGSMRSVPLRPVKRKQQ